MGDGLLKGAVMFIPISLIIGVLLVWLLVKGGAVDVALDLPSSYILRLILGLIALAVLLWFRLILS